MSPQIDWKTYSVIIGNGKVVQSVPVAPDDVRPSLHEITAKTAVQLARQQGSTAQFAFIKSPQNVQTGLLASASRTGETLMAAPSEFQTLESQYRDVFAELRNPAPGQVTHKIELHNELLMLPR